VTDVVAPKSTLRDREAELDRRASLIDTDTDLSFGETLEVAARGMFLARHFAGRFLLKLTLMFFAIAVIALLWFALRQPETLPAARRRSLAPRALGRDVLEVLRIRSALGFTLASGSVFAPFIAYLSSAQQIFQEAYTTGALFPVYFGGLVLAVGGASLANGRLVMKHGMRRLSLTAAVATVLISIPMWMLTFAFGGLPPLWLFSVYLLAVFFAFGLLFANLNALAMEPLGHLAGVGSSVVSSLSVFIAVPLGTVVGLSFDGTMFTQIAAFAVFGAGGFVAMRWAGRGRAAGPDPG